MSTIGQRLKALREPLSQKAAALAVGIKQPVWNRYEKDQTAPASESIIKICLKFGCSANWLLGLPETTERASIIAPNNRGAISVTGSAVVSQPLGEDPSCEKCPYKRQLKSIKKALGSP